MPDATKDPNVVLAWQPCTSHSTRDHRTSSRPIAGRWWRRGSDLAWPSRRRHYSHYLRRRRNPNAPSLSWDGGGSVLLVVYRTEIGSAIVSFPADAACWQSIDSCSEDVVHRLVDHVTMVVIKLFAGDSSTLTRVASRFGELLIDVRAQRDRFICSLASRQVDVQ